jgi:predicted nucleotidyltransferase
MMEAGESIAPFVPSEARHIPEREMAAGRGPVTMERLEQAALSRLRQLSEAHFAALPDATEGLDNRLYRAVRSEPSVEAVLSAVKTKRYPLSRLRRMVMCAVLGVRADMTANRPSYARLLASTERGRGLLRRMDGICTVPIINKPAAAKELEGSAGEIFTLTADARDFYVLGYQAVGERRGGTDWRTSPVTL